MSHTNIQETEGEKKFIIGGFDYISQFVICCNIESKRGSFPWKQMRLYEKWRKVDWRNTLTLLWKKIVLCTWHVYKVFAEIDSSS
jgi:hypothetical protein